MGVKLCGVLAWILAAVLIVTAGGVAHAEDGYDLWLRYRPLPTIEAGAVRRHLTGLLRPSTPSPTIAAAVDELDRALSGMVGATPNRLLRTQDGALLIGTPASSPIIAALGLDLSKLGRDGYAVRSVRLGGRAMTVVAANSDIGVLYGTFALIARIERHEPLDRLDIVSAPRIALRVLDHWDNLDRSVERGYAGQSIWDWWKLPAYRNPRYRDYARANASIGINGAVLNNVNARADSLTPGYIAKAAAVADVLRPYGMRVYLSARFSAPIDIGGLKTSDPLNPAVIAWWKAKSDEIYRTIPDFGGFLVKANSEGQPGPRDYGRSHADGANMLAATLRPHGGVVMWRAFVYAATDPDDRAKQAFDEFKPLDGRFADNVLLQVKNGPIDFQPREPFHPLFGAMPNTAIMPEFQLTKEYLGFATHLVYLGPLIEEVLRSDTMARGPGSSVARIVDGSLDRHRISGIAGVANIGSDRNWTGSIFNQANWYAFGRFAWNPDSSSKDIAGDWLCMTLSCDPQFSTPVSAVMMTSRQAAVDYMTPLGLAHLMGTGHHYGPAPWVSDQSRPEWNPVYYHRADRDGIGFDRTASGSNAIAQYAAPVAARFGGLDAVSDDYLLWFHHVRWDYRMRHGATLWDTLVRRYDRGVAAVTAMRAAWEVQRGRVDAARFHQTAAFLAVQESEARWWRDASLAYFQSLNRLPLPAGSRPPEHPLAYYQALRFPYAPGQ